nr:ArsR family transcriptional regulator [Acetobacter okinawensis]
MILDALLEHSSLAVGELETCTGIGQPTLSQQLGALRRAEIVVPRRESRTIHYSLASEEEALRARALIGLLRGDRAALPACVLSPSVMRPAIAPPPSGRRKVVPSSP